MKALDRQSLPGKFVLLGSCASLVSWHPKLLIGGMCHSMLPTRPQRPTAELDGRYGDEAIELMLRKERVHGIAPGEFRIQLFGGGNMFPEIGRQKDNHVAKKNVEAAKQLLQAHGLTCSGAQYQVEIRDSPPVSRHRPSVDVLFRRPCRRLQRPGPGRGQLRGLRHAQGSTQARCGGAGAAAGRYSRGDPRQRGGQACPMSILPPPARPGARGGQPPVQELPLTRGVSFRDKNTRWRT